MDPSDCASTLKMRGRCRTLGPGHHDRRNRATGAYQTYAEDAKVVTCGVVGRHPDNISRCAIRLPALSVAWPRRPPRLDAILN